MTDTSGAHELSLQDLRKQINELRDFLEIQLSAHSEILEALRVPVDLVTEENRVETEEKQEEAANPERVQSFQSPKNRHASFVEETMMPFRAKVKMQSQKLRISKAVAEVEELDLRERVGQIVFSSSFSLMITALILVNVVLLGVEVDVSATMAIEDVPSWFGTVNALIVCVFVLEIALKVFALGCRSFWCGRDCVWNLVDFVIVSVSVVDVSLDFVASMLSSNMNTGHLRLVRSIRLARALRGVRVVRIFRYITALRTLALSIISTMGSLFWTLTLLVMVFYFFAVVITQLVTDHCRFELQDDADCPELLKKYWASVSESFSPHEAIGLQLISHILSVKL